VTRPITILVEGDSDRAAVETLAPRYGIDLAEQGIEVVSMGGAGNVGRSLAAAVAAGHRVGGLYDEGEERFVARALGRQEGEDLTGQGFFACRRDLEDELIRAIGLSAMMDLLAAHGELDAFRTLQHQPAHRDGEVADQLHRFLGTSSGRKIRYGAIMAEAVPLESLPEPLEGLLGWIWSVA
jgi:hypothetical protein